MVSIGNYESTDPTYPNVDIGSILRNDVLEVKLLEEIELEALLFLLDVRLEEVCA